MSDPHPRQHSNIARNLLALFFLLIASWIVWLHLQKRALINQENMAVQQIDAGKPAAAVLILLQLRQEFYKEKDIQRIDSYLADCYLQLAENPENSTEVSLLYYRRLFRLDPTRVPESIRQRLYRLDSGEEN
jgi:hypothetical protein